MKKLFLFLTATILSLTASAQGTIPGNDKEHVIYATIEGMTASDDYSVEAYIGDECRATAFKEAYRDVTGAVKFYYYALRVKGSTSDAGKDITFKIDDPTTKSFYTLTQTLAYVPEGTTGEPSNLYVLNFKKATSYTYKETSVELYPGSTYTIDYTVTPTGGQLPDGFDEHFYAVQTSAFSVSGKTVTADVLGSGTVDNWTGGVTATNTLTINVVERPIPVTAITVAPNAFDIAVGDELDCGMDMTITVAPNNATNKNYTLSTTNSDIVEVHNPGARGAYIKGLKKGTATVKVIAEDGSGVSATFTVNVFPALTGFTISATDIEMASQTKTVLTITPTPTDALVKDELTVSVTKPDAITRNAPSWKYVDAAVTRNASGAYEVALTAYAMGEGTLSVGCGNYLSKDIPLHVGFQYNLANGWNWMSTFTDNRSTVAQTMQQMLGNDLVEARTQTGLLYNDPKYGYFGDFTDFGTTAEMYKVKGKAAKTYMLFGDYNYDSTIGLQTGWNWIPYNCEYDQTIALAANEGDVILSLTDGFATYTNNAWSPADFKLKAGQGYLFYTTNTPELTLPNPYECEQPATIGTAQARSFEQKFWNYNPREHSSIMPIIAEIEGYNSSEYTVGAFVGNECRGEGRFVDGKWFITVAGEGGETVSFRIYNKVTGSTVNVENTVKMASILGSAKAPVKMNVGIATVINNAEMNITDSNAWYNLNGQKVTTPQKGIFINNGRKVLVK